MPATETKTARVIATKASDAGLDLKQIEALMIARGIDPNEISPEVVASRFIRVKASDETVDGIGDVVRYDAWDLDAWLNNPALFMDHKQERPHTTARGLQAFVDTTDKGLYIDAFFLPQQLDKFGLGEFTYQMYKSGCAKDVSIGAIPAQSHRATQSDVTAFGPSVRRVWDKAILKEVSFVGIGMNDAAKITAIAKSANSNEIDIAVLENVADGEYGDWTIAAKAALMTVKAMRTLEPTPAPVPEPASVTNIVNQVDPEIKSMLLGMSQRLAAQEQTQKQLMRQLRTKSEVKDDQITISLSDLETVLTYIGSAVEILGALMPAREDDVDDLITEDDAAPVITDGDKCDANKEDQAATRPEVQRLEAAVQNVRVSRAQVN